jgi:hypothetical protein
MAGILSDLETGLGHLEWECANRTTGAETRTDAKQKGDPSQVALMLEIVGKDERPAS